MDDTVELNQSEETRPRLTDADAHRAAELLVQLGLSTGGVAKIMYPAEYNSPKKEIKSRAIMRVKHLLHRAVHRGIVVVNAPANKELAGRLRALPEFRDVTFEIVADNGDFPPLDPAEPVYREAASLVAKKIDGLMTNKRGEVVIANAGGPALSRLTEFLPAVATHHQQSSRLRFISLNAARHPEHYDLSANFIAVRMAAIFGGRHVASLRRSFDSNREDYKRLVEAVDLVICGAGSKEGFLSRWLYEVYEQAALPPSVIGDICLTPIDELGNKVSWPRELGRRIDEDLRPRPSFDALKQLARQDKILVVFAHPRSIDGSVAETSGPPSSKIEIATAILRQPLTRWCVLGTSLAEQILRHTNQMRDRKERTR